jgi:signal transduction histidine kinase
VSRTPCTIAHDLRGVINVVRGSADLARGKLEPNHPAGDDIARIIRACEEIAALTMELRAMSCVNVAGVTGDPG